MQSNSLNNEAFLLKEIANDQEYAFREIVVHYHSIIYSIALRMTDHAALSEDVVQDTFMKMWLHRKTLPELENFSGWLYRIATNQIINAIARSNTAQKYRNKILNAPLSYIEFPEYKMEQKDLQVILDQATKLLPKKQFQAYYLVKVLGKTRAEAAKEMNVSPETIKSNLDIAMRFLRAYCIKALDGKAGIPLLFILFT